MEEQGQLPFFNNPNCDRVLANNPMPEPDKDGFFDFLGVSAIAGRRECTVKKLSELAMDVVGQKRLHVKDKDRTITLTAIAPGLWDPVSIISACTRARGLTVFEVDLATAKPKNEGRLNEIKIARICGADGLRPYLSKKSRYTQRDGNGGDIRRPLPMRWPDGYSEHHAPGFAPAGAGKPTWAFKEIMWSAEPSETREPLRSNSYPWRKAVRTLQDVGLLDGRRVRAAAWFAPPAVGRRWRTCLRSRHRRWKSITTTTTRSTAWPPGCRITDDIQRYKVCDVTVG